MNALIGSHGVIGQSLCDHMSFDQVFNSNNITQLPPGLATVTIAAPSGNRLKINQGHGEDRSQCSAIVSAVLAAEPQHVILIGSVDAVTAPESEYGRNRAWLEQQLSAHLPTTVLRLCTLIGTHIQKNVLYDIKHSQFLDQADAGAWLQWCILDDLLGYIQSAVPGTTRDLVSEPIQTLEVLSRYAPGHTPGYKAVSPYYNQQPYVYSKAEIFAAMDRYML